VIFASKYHPTQHSIVDANNYIVNAGTGGYSILLKCQLTFTGYLW